MRFAAWQTQRYYLDRCHEVRRLLRFEPVFVLGTALGLMGIETGEDFMTHIAVPSREAYRNMPPSIICHTWNQLDRNDAVIRIFDVWCTSPAATFAHLAQRYSCEELVVLADRMDCRDPLLHRATAQEIERFVRCGRYLTARDLSLHALRLSLPGTDSPFETRLRLAVLKRGFPAPTINHPLLVGGRKKILDMAYIEFRVAMEYNGAHHATQYVDDCERLNALTAQEWKIFPAWASMLRDPVALDRYTANVRTALIAAGGAAVLTGPQNLWSLSDGRHYRYRKSHTQVGL